MNSENRQKLIKKLLYQSTHRGCKETDLILGNFAKSYLADLSEPEMEQFADILDLPDAQIYDWYTNKKPVPHEHKSTLLAKILAFDLSR